MDALLNRVLRFLGIVDVEDLACLVSLHALDDKFSGCRNPEKGFWKMRKIFKPSEFIESPDKGFSDRRIKKEFFDHTRRISSRFPSHLTFPFN